MLYKVKSVNSYDEPKEKETEVDQPHWWLYVYVYVDVYESLFPHVYLCLSFLTIWGSEKDGGIRIKGIW